MTLSVIIVNYNTKDLLRKCLSSVYSSRVDFLMEVIVSDNGSKDQSLNMVKSEFKQVLLIENGQNLGFSKANNVAIKKAKGEFVLLLNSDTELEANALQESVNYLKTHINVGVLGGKVILPDGSLDKACRRKFPNPANSFLRLFGLQKYSDYNIQGPIDQEMEIDATTGAYMMVRRSAMEKVGLLDEQFFMYGEDLDWCMRFKNNGFKVVYFPKAVIKHYKYGSSQQIPFRIIQASHDAMKIFYKKHYASSHSFVFNQFIYLGIDLRKLLVFFVNVFREKKSVH